MKVKGLELNFSQRGAPGSIVGRIGGNLAG